MVLVNNYYFSQEESRTGEIIVLKIKIREWKIDDKAELAENLNNMNRKKGVNSNE